MFCYRLDRKEEVMINRLRPCHTRMTRLHLFAKALTVPICPFCNNRLTVHHLLIDCISLRDQRNEHLVLMLEERQSDIDPATAAAVAAHYSN